MSCLVTRQQPGRRGRSVTGVSGVDVSLAPVARYRCAGRRVASRYGDLQYCNLL
ncbi:hypothetical protein [Actinoplanes flavus]|uniref:Uncharacterized protein n=1 Tax=Actinoplanes flavus TaxID=2820290 RepID=A0ABS3UX92_9ACTN|nr:hypothetical protein [Actinoplanes flavus]MBO3743151.1 hypothetical protein [Actinoplanes flavus]